MNDCAGNICILDGAEKTLHDLTLPVSTEGEPVYEVIRIYKGHPLFLGDHLKRIKKSFRLCERPLFYSDSKIALSLENLIKANDLENGAAKLIFTLENGDPHLLIYSMKPYMPEPAEYVTGVRTTLLHAERKLPNAKIWIDEFRLTTARNISDKSVFEGILMNSDGFVTEGSRSNIFFIDGETVFTPPERDILPGITRKKVLQLLNKRNVQVSVQPLYASRLKDFETAFLSGTTRKIVPVRSIDEIQFNPRHTLLDTLMLDFDRLVNEYVENLMAKTR